MQMKSCACGRISPRSEQRAGSQKHPLLAITLEPTAGSRHAATVGACYAVASDLLKGLPLHHGKKVTSAFYLALGV